MSSDEQIAAINEIFPELAIIEQSKDAYTWSYRCSESDKAFSSPVAALADFAQDQAVAIDKSLGLGDEDEEEDETPPEVVAQQMAVLQEIWAESIEEDEL